MFRLVDISAGMNTSTCEDAFEFVTSQGQFSEFENKIEINVEFSGAEVGVLEGTM